MKLRGRVRGAKREGRFMDRVQPPDGAAGGQGSAWREGSLRVGDTILQVRGRDVGVCGCGCVSGGESPHIAHGEWGLRKRRLRRRRRGRAD